MVAAGVLLVAGAWPAGARAVSPAQKKQLALTQWETAQRMREELNGRPGEDRTRRDYQRVTDAYRRVYYTSPASSKADAAVVAVAELLAETGRRFNDPKALQAAIGQYEFLRREYPGSRYRVDALFTIGQIYKDDLKDFEQAKAAFQDFLKRYPRASNVDDARNAVAELEQPPEKKKPAEVREALGAKPQRTPLVTGVRHWSTPDYTRVAIDLESGVKYEAGRVPNPDRIFFDLYDAKLASVLVGKSFEVSDGFLRKIRVAQYQRGMVRVVLEVSDVSDYSAFLLPNPYRLIVDIHGRRPATLLAKKDAPKEDSSARKDEPLNLATKVADGTTTPLKADVHLPATAKAPELAKESLAPKSGNAGPSARAAKSGSPARDTKSTGAPTRDEKANTRSLDARQKQALARDTKSVGAPARDQKRVTDARDATSSGTAEVARLSEPEPKAIPKPTSGPTFESVAPRETLPRSKRKGAITEASVRAARPTANGETSLIRALGLKIGKIVVDAGHGGHDTGTIGANGLQEKDLVLDVALRLGKLLESKMGADVVYTREDDTFIPLETRTAIANQNQADLFISIHANSSGDADARGVETYYLNFTSDRSALDVAARENAVSDTSIHELQGLVKKIALKEKIEESREFASEVQRALWTGESAKSPGIRNRGVKKAPFIVLIGANMPSILAEISFLSNPTDEKRLQTPEYRQKIAEYLYRGIAKYVSGLSGVKLAQHRTSEGQ